MSRRTCRTGTMLALTAVLLSAQTGCRREAGPESLRQAWTHAAERRVNEALPLVKDYLVWHPEDAAAHYILGVCYLHRPDVNTTLAKGEFETALYYFGRNTDLGILAPELTPSQFQSALHRDIALALMRAVYEGERGGLTAPVLFPVLKQALEHVREGLWFDPASGYLQDMERSLSELCQKGAIPVPPRGADGRSGEITI